MSVGSGLLRAIVDFGRHEEGLDLLLVAVHGWSHSQSRPELAAAMHAGYRRLRDVCVQAVRRRQAAGTIDPAADAKALGELMVSIALGFVAQRAMTGTADVRAHVDALHALARRPGTRATRTKRSA